MNSGILVKSPFSPILRSGPRQESQEQKEVNWPTMTEVYKVPRSNEKMDMHDFFKSKKAMELVKMKGPMSSDVGSQPKAAVSD